MRKNYYKTHWELTQNGDFLKYEAFCENYHEFDIQPEEIMWIITDITHCSFESDRNDFGTWKHLCVEVLNNSNTHEIIVPCNSDLSSLIEHHLITGTIMYVTKNDLIDDSEDDICYNIS